MLLRNYNFVKIDAVKEILSYFLNFFRFGYVKFDVKCELFLYTDILMLIRFLGF